MSDSDLTAHGRLIEAARGSMSKRRAATLAGISEGRWRQIVTGVQRVGGGQTIPANPRRETLVAMATAVGANVADVLRAAGFTSTAGDEQLTGAPDPATGAEVNPLEIEDDFEAMQEFLRQRAARRGRPALRDTDDWEPR